MEYIIVGIIVIIAGCILYTTIKKQANGDCGCGNGCAGCDHSCDTKPSTKKNNKLK